MAKGIETTDVSAPVTDSGTPDNTDVGSTDAAEQSSQIEEMFDAIIDETTVDDKEPEGETPDVDEPSGDKPPTSEEPPETPQDKRIKELEDKIAELMGKMTNPEQPPKSDEELKDDEEKYFKERIDEVQKDLVSEYVSDEDYEAVFEKREKLNEVLKKVQNDTIQGVFRSIPRIIATMIPQHITFYNKTAEFYKNNPDLYEHRKTVGQVIDETSAKNPGWNIDKILEHVGGKGEEVGEVRKRLGLKKQAIKAAEKENIKRPSFAKPAHVRQPGKEVQLTGVQKEIKDMLDTL